MKEFTSCIGSITMALVLIVYGILMGGIVMDRFYYWFILPIFNTLPSITLAQAIGLSIFADLIRGYRYTKEDKGETKEEKYTKITANSFYYPILLLFGWIIHLIIS